MIPSAAAPRRTHSGSVSAPCFAIGIALIWYVDSEALNNWPGVASIPIWYGIGWATYGFIVGGGGIFAHLGRKTRPKERKEVLDVPVRPAA